MELFYTLDKTQTPRIFTAEERQFMKNLLHDFIEWLTTTDQMHPKMKFQGGMFYKIFIVVLVAIIFLGIIKSIISW